MTCWHCVASRREGRCAFDDTLLRRLEPAAPYSAAVAPAARARDEINLATPLLGQRPARECRRGPRLKGSRGNEGLVCVQAAGAAACGVCADISQSID